MDRQDPRTRARYLFAAALLGALLSQPGHLVGYLGHYGWRGLAIEGQGVHGYFPSLLSTSIALLGGIALAALLGVAAARLVIGRALGRRRARGVPFTQLLLVLLLIQLNLYAVQEMLELEAVGRALTPAGLAGIAAWGLVGQVPPAILAAVALALLSSPLLAVFAALRSPFTRSRAPVFRLSAPLLAAVFAEAPIAALQGQRFPVARPRRGPPPSPAC
jgi:hypothetical protein